MNLKINEIINNAIDELERARELLSNNEIAEKSMLLSDIDSSLERMQNINERIEFALIISMYLGMINAQNDFIYDIDNSEWREKILYESIKIDLQYEDGYIDSEWAYEMADSIAKKLWREYGLQNS